MKRVIAILPFFLLITGIASAQDDQLPPPSSNPQPDISQLPQQSPKQCRQEELSKYIIEPNLVFSSSLGVSVGASAYLGHQLWKNLYGGGGVTYINTEFKNLQFTDATGNIHLTNAHWNTYGAGVFLQYNVWRGFFVRDQFEVLHRDIADVYNAQLQYNPQTSDYSIKIPQIQRNIPNMLLGIGYNLLEGKHFFLPLTLSYNVLGSNTNKLYAVYPEGWVIQFSVLTVF